MGWTFLNNLIDVTGYITADSTWRTTSTITELPEGVKTIWMRIRQTDATSRTIGATHPDITFTGTGDCHSNKPQYFMIGVKDRTFRYYCQAKTNQYWEILAYGDNDNEAYTTAGNYPVKTPSIAGAYQYRSFSELATGAAFAALLVDQGGTVYKSGFRHDGASYDEYNACPNAVISTVFCPLENNSGEIKVDNISNSPCYLTAGLVAGAVRFSAPQDINIPTTGWTTITASNVFPAGANIAILEFRNTNTTTARTCVVRNTGSTENITNGVNLAYSTAGPVRQFKLVGLNSSGQFDVNVSNTTDVLVKAYGYISNSSQLMLDNYLRLNIGMMDISINYIKSIKKHLLEIELK